MRQPIIWFLGPNAPGELLSLRTVSETEHWPIPVSQVLVGWFGSWCVRVCFGDGENTTLKLAGRYCLFSVGCS